MYIERLANGDFNSWSEYCTLNELAKDEYEQQLALEEYAKEEYIMENNKENNGEKK